MQIILNLDEALVEEALELTKLTTQEKLIELALLASGFDHKALRDTGHPTTLDSGFSLATFSCHLGEAQN